MNRTLDDIKLMLARIWLLYDNVGVEAETQSEYLTLSERYGVFINDSDEAFQIINEWSLLECQSRCLKKDMGQ